MKSIVKLTYFFVHYVKIWSFLFIRFVINLFIPIICKYKSTQNKVLLSISKYSTFITVTVLDCILVPGFFMHGEWMVIIHTKKRAIHGECCVNDEKTKNTKSKMQVKCKWNASKMQVKCKCLEQKCEHKWVWFTDIEWDWATCRQNLFKPSL